MKIDIDKHPCFNDKIRHLFGRIHVPVAPRCNLQCNYCNRKFDCANESRPGVTSNILTPEQALYYIDTLMDKNSNISVVGIAGPGDPFANPEETMTTLRLVREKYNDMLLCVATNGLNLLPYINELAELEVSHFTITINAVDPEIAERIYSWMRYKKRVMKSSEAAAILLSNQMESITALKTKGMIVKINSIIIPGINEEQITVIAEKVGDLGADIFNPIPYYPSEGCNFAHIKEPSKELVNSIRKKTEQYLPQMRHCTRCRADAAGLLGEKMTEEMFDNLQRCSTLNLTEDKSRTEPHLTTEVGGVAVASMEGALINQHLGEADSLLIYKRHINGYVLDRKINTPPRGNGKERWENLAELLHDCSAILVSGVGHTPGSMLEEKGIHVMVMEGIIEEALSGIFNGKNINHMIKRTRTVCGAQCSGSADNCQ